MKKTTAIFPIALVAMPLLTGCGSSDEASFDDPTTDQSADAGIDVGGGINVDDGTESAGESSTAQTSSESSNSRGRTRFCTTRIRMMSLPATRSRSMGTYPMAAP